MMKVVALVAVGFISGIAFTVLMLFGLFALAAGRRSRPLTKEEWKVR